MLSTTGGKLKITPKEILSNYRKIKKINPKKNCVIGFGITEKSIGKLKSADGLVVGSAICKEISKSIPNLAPDYFFIGLQNNQKLEFINFIKNKDSLAVINAMPMVSVKLIKINNKFEIFNLENIYSEDYFKDKKIIKIYN